MSIPQSDLLSLENPPLNWMDAHCHLSDDLFDADLQSTYEDLMRLNIRGLVLAGTEPRDWSKQIDLDPPPSLKIAQVFGMHPWWVDDFQDEDLEIAFAKLKDLLPKCVGIGELGLDYFRAKSPEMRERQKLWFKAQLTLASTTTYPLVLHVVKAHHDALPILRKQRVKQKRLFRGIVHSYWANLETAKSYIDLGFMLSVPTRIMRGDPHKLLTEIHPDHVVFETDTPYFDSTNNLVRPTFIRDLLMYVSGVRGEKIQVTVSRQEKLLTQLFPTLKASI